MCYLFDTFLNESWSALYIFLFCLLSISIVSSIFLVNAPNRAKTVLPGVFTRKIHFSYLKRGFVKKKLGHPIDWLSSMVQINFHLIYLHQWGENRIKLAFGRSFSNTRKLGSHFYQIHEPWKSNICEYQLVVLQHNVH